IWLVLSSPSQDVDDRLEIEVGSASICVGVRNKHLMSPCFRLEMRATNQATPKSHQARFYCRAVSAARLSGLCLEPRTDVLQRRCTRSGACEISQPLQITDHLWRRYSTL